MKFYVIPATVLLTIFTSANSLGCIPDICRDQPNEVRKCPDDDGTCGAFGGRRVNSRIIKGVDLVCDADVPVFAPFDGEMYYWRPLGGRTGLDCLDKGVRIEGSGQWQGYVAFMAFVEPTAFGRVNKSSRIGQSVNLECSGTYFPSNKNFQNHIQFQLTRGGKLVDPTFHLTQCMCTGQICESNLKNSLVGAEFKHDSRFNGVRGWELQCNKLKDAYDGHGNMIPELERVARVPTIYSPIEGEYIGRIRLRSDGTRYQGCDNDGILVKGTGAWNLFEARIYNVRMRADLPTGTRRIAVGQEIGTRLDCPGATNSDSVFIEVRHRGRFIDLSKAISAKNCSMPAFYAPESIEEDSFIF